MSNDNDHYTSHSGATSEEPGKVTVLPPEERENFKGITIEAGGSGKQEENQRGYSEYEYHDPYKRVYVRQVRLNNALSWLFFGFLALVIVFLVLPFFSFLFIPILIPMFILILLNNLLRRR
ncbi:MAG: hypothetical protein ACM3X9_00400 [Bacillota bacterium]